MTHRCCKSLPPRWWSSTARAATCAAGAARARATSGRRSSTASTSTRTATSGSAATATRTTRSSKFTPDGKFLMQIGRAGRPGGSNSHDAARPARAHGARMLHASELYVADGYGNRRVIVFDAKTGAYKRHWGAYGTETPNDEQAAGLQARQARAISASFGNPVHCVRLSQRRPGRHVCDRVNDRIQVFDRQGTLQAPSSRVEAQTLADGSAWDMEQSALPCRPSSVYRCRRRRGQRPRLCPAPRATARWWAASAAPATWPASLSGSTTWRSTCAGQPAIPPRSASAARAASSGRSAAELPCRRAHGHDRLVRRRGPLRRPSALVDARPRRRRCWRTRHSERSLRRIRPWPRSPWSPHPAPLARGPHAGVGTSGRRPSPHLTTRGTISPCRTGRRCAAGSPRPASSWSAAAARGRCASARTCPSLSSGPSAPRAGLPKPVRHRGERVVERIAAWLLRYHQTQGQHQRRRRTRHAARPCPSAGTLHRAAGVHLPPRAAVRRQMHVLPRMRAGCRQCATMLSGARGACASGFAW
mgnify:CR=1 FL=1